jgi:hypothetical protein
VDVELSDELHAVAIHPRETAARTDVALTIDFMGNLRQSVTK